MSAAGTFKEGRRLKDYTLKDIPAFSGKLLKEFDKRRSIKDMFGKKPALTHQQSSSTPAAVPDAVANTPPAVQTSFEKHETNGSDALPAEPQRPSISMPTASQSQPSRTTSPEQKRKASETTPRPAKRSKSNGKSAEDKPADKGQQSLKGFFASKTNPQKPTSDGKSPVNLKADAGAAEKENESGEATAAL